MTKGPGLTVGTGGGRRDGEERGGEVAPCPASHPHGARGEAGALPRAALPLSSAASGSQASACGGDEARGRPALTTQRGGVQTEGQERRRGPPGPFCVVQPERRAKQLRAGEGQRGSPLPTELGPRGARAAGGGDTPARPARQDCP